jgi:hypothetical protein
MDRVIFWIWIQPCANKSLGITMVIVVFFAKFLLHIIWLGYDEKAMVKELVGRRGVKVATAEVWPATGVVDAPMRSATVLAALAQAWPATGVMELVRKAVMVRKSAMAKTSSVTASGMSVAGRMQGSATKAGELMVKEKRPAGVGREFREV